MRFTRRMRTPPHAPFLSLRLGFAEEGCFPDAPGQAVRDFARSLAATARLARALAEAGERIDLAGLAGHVGLLCARALDLAPDQGREMRVELITLRGDLDALAHALRLSLPDP
jgi:hypothetical protein